MLYGDKNHEEDKPLDWTCIPVNIPNDMVFPYLDPFCDWGSWSQKEDIEEAHNFICEHLNRAARLLLGIREEQHRPCFLPETLSSNSCRSAAETANIRAELSYRTESLWKRDSGAERNLSTGAVRGMLNSFNEASHKLTASPLAWLPHLK